MADEELEGSVTVSSACQTTFRSKQTDIRVVTEVTAVISKSSSTADQAR